MFGPPPPSSRPPRRPPPPGACDCHAHIFGPEQFPPAGETAYAPPPAPYAAYRAMLQGAGGARGGLVQPAAHRLDHRAILDACARAGGQVKAIGLADDSIGDDMLFALRQGGVAGLRFVEMTSPTGSGRYPGSVGFDQLIALAPRMKGLGLQAHLWCGLEHLLDQAPRLLGLGLALVIDHMGQFDAGAGVSAAPFQRFLDHVRDGHWWVKLSLCRISSRYPDYPDARPFHDALVAANPDRLLWGSDWPHLRLGDKTPDVGHLLDLFDDWVSDQDH